MNTTTEEKKKSMREKILERIKRGAVVMKPRWHFVLKAALVAAGAIFALLAALFFASFFLFALRHSGVWFAPSFGMRGIGLFFLSLPWFLILVGVAFVIILEILVKKYSFAYRRPLLYSAAAIVLLVLAGSIALSPFNLHERALRFSEERHIPFTGSFYRGFAEPPLQDVHLFVIQALTEDGFLGLNRRGESLRIIITPDTRFPAGIDLMEGDEIVVLGPRATDTVEAFGIRRIAPDKRQPKPPGGPIQQFRRHR